MPQYSVEREPDAGCRIEAIRCELGIGEGDLRREQTLRQSLSRQCEAFLKRDMPRQTRVRQRVWQDVDEAVRGL